MGYSQAIGLAGVAAAAGVNMVNSGAQLPWYYRLLGVGKPDYPTTGHADKEFDSVKKRFAEHFEKGLEVGASVAVYSRGRKVVELYGGFSNFLEGKPYTKDTLQSVFDTSKVLESLAVARLVDEGCLSYDDSVADIWPEFGVEGKETVTVGDVLRHEAGTPYFKDPQPSFQDLMDRNKLATTLAKQRHIYGGNKTRAYHTVTRGWILNEIVQRVDPKGRTLGEIYKEDFNQVPDMGMEFHLGLDQDQEKRKAHCYKYPSLEQLLRTAVPGLNYFDFSSILRGGSSSRNTTKIWDSLGPDYENHELYSSFQIPSSNCFTNACSLATLGAFLANCGQLYGQSIISRGTLEEALSAHSEDFDICLFANTKLTRGGFGVFTFLELGRHIEFYGWTGFGSSLMLFCPSHDFSFSYVTNAQHLPEMIGWRARRLLVNAFKSHQMPH